MRFTRWLWRDGGVEDVGKCRTAFAETLRVLPDPDLLGPDQPAPPLPRRSLRRRVGPQQLALS